LAIVLALFFASHFPRRTILSFTLPVTTGPRTRPRKIFTLIASIPLKAPIFVHTGIHRWLSLTSVVTIIIARFGPVGAVRAFAFQSLLQNRHLASVLETEFNNQTGSLAYVL
jgi:hypothetical protein